MAKERIIEIDLLRTIAIVMMVIYHAAFDIHINLDTPLWETLRLLTVGIFLVVSGMSTPFSRSPLKRALVVLGCALLISTVTYIYNKDYFIYFGILHCIGGGMLLLIPLKKLQTWNIGLGLLVLLIPVIPPPRDTLDYYPLFPWIGLMLIGAGLSHYLYIQHTYRLLKKVPRALLLPGRHALLIYMIHQPILLATLYLLHAW